MKPEKLMERLKAQAPRRVAVAAAQDSHVLEAVSLAYKEGIALPVLCGDIEKIDAIARMNNINIAPFELIETDSDAQSAAVAVSMVRQGKADVLMKGLLQSADLLRAVLNKDNGLRGGGVLSHVGVLHSPGLDRTWFLTDSAMVPYPSLQEKAELIRSAVKVARSMGVELPRVAPLAAVELVNPAMQATLDAAQLTLMNRRGQIWDCIVDGPLAFDLAVSEEAARLKGVESEVAGRADVLLFHNIEAGNSTMKAMTQLGGCLLGGVVMGAKAPIVLTSRSDSALSKLYAIACACAVSL